MERDVKKAAEAVDDDMDDVGDEWGKTSSKAMGDRLKDEAPAIAKKLEEGLRRAKVTTKVRVEFDKDNNIIRRFEETVTTSLREAFDSASKPGGPLGKIGQGIADAIGAGFNVSGKSPLIGFFAILILAIGDLVIAAVQAVNALTAVAFVVPQILASLGLQVGVLALAFHGLGGAISAAFAAKNAKELKEALKDLQPAAASFVKELLPLKGIFSTLSDIAQQAFFKELAGSITRIINAFNKISFFEGIRSLASVLGNTFRLIADFLGGPTFTAFIKETIPLTITWLKEFGPSFTNWLDKLFGFFRKLEPFLDFFGEFFSQNFDDWARFFEDLGNDPGMEDWLNSAKETLQLLEDLLFSVVDFFKQLMQTVDEAGGKNAIKALTDAIDQLTFFFSTDIAKEGLKLLIDSAILGIQIITGLFELIILVFGGVRVAFVETGNFFDWLGGKILAGVEAIKKWFRDLGAKIDEIGQGIKDWINSIPHLVSAAFKDAKNFLFTAGRNIVQGLIDGLKSMIPSLGGMLSNIFQMIRDHSPFSPAKIGPLSGSGDPLKAGQNIVDRLGEGMHMEIPRLRATTSNVANNIVFGAGSIQQSFQGLPTVTQAQGIGAGVAAGISDGLTDRDVRLRVRSM